MNGGARPPHRSVVQECLVLLSSNVRTHAYNVRCSTATWTYLNQSTCVRMLN